jgi:GH24 family phage-related lysozyme (muramidase)
MDGMIDVTVAELASAIIFLAEGTRLRAYKDTGGVWTIGLGHTRGVIEGMTITVEQAAQFFAEDAGPLFRMVASRPILEAAALVSFGFNVGAGALADVLGGHDTIANTRHTTDRHGNVQPALQNRRHLEELLTALSQQLTAKP